MTTRKKTQQIASSLADKDYSQAFVEAEIATTIPSQIRALRQEREWTQADLARETGQQQKTISDFENPDIGPKSIASLRRIAAAFDVGMIVRFAPFSELVDWSAHMTTANHRVPSRTKDEKLRIQQSGGGYHCYGFHVCSDWIRLGTSPSNWRRKCEESEARSTRLAAALEGMVGAVERDGYLMDDDVVAAARAALREVGRG